MKEDIAALKRRVGALERALCERHKAPTEPALDMRLLNARGLLERVELMLRDGSMADERKRKDLLFDLEALKGRC